MSFTLLVINKTMPPGMAASRFGNLCENGPRASGAPPMVICSEDDSVLHAAQYSIHRHSQAFA